MADDTGNHGDRGGGWPVDGGDWGAGGRTRLRSPVADEKAYGDAIGKAWDNPATARRRAADAQLVPGLANGAGVLAAYRSYNEPQQARTIYDSDFGAAIREPSSQQFGRGYVAYWEARNLRMAANIREAIGRAPGGRTLVLVGASHKFYLQAYLDMMQDVRLVDTADVLAP